MLFSSPKTVAARTDSRGGPIVSFDFYDTMTLPEFDPKLQTWRRGVQPNNFVLAEMVRLRNEGWRPIIATDEHKTDYAVDIINAFTEKYELPIDGIIYTAGNEKAMFLRAIPTVIHYDDDPHEIDALLHYAITGVLVPHPSDYLTEAEQAMMKPVGDIA
jgi:hypothetical protein